FCSVFKVQCVSASFEATLTMLHDHQLGVNNFFQEVLIKFVVFRCPFVATNNTLPVNFVEVNFFLNVF
ncbi:hypothetical protein ACFQWC_23155, partial [Rossellomorea sp. GCM10028870]|uniref:hypothetical protein n=1 Tax=Rossellomorea sp. GCM10028870 TaxID=3273426 RepID=UPI00361EC7A2